MNKFKFLVPGFLALAMAFASLAAHAQTSDDMSFAGMTKVEQVDTNKDGRVSKAEFLAAMGKVWDMKAKDMKVKGGKMKEADYMALAGFLSRGEKNK
jgi:hypothetical protein